MEAPSRRARRITIVALGLFGAGLTLTALAGARDTSAPAGVRVAEAAWHLRAIRAPDAWERSLGDGAVVAVVDSGVDRSHPDLAGAVIGGADCIGTAGEPAACRAGGDDVNGHGTHVAGIIAARGPSGGATGVAPRARLLAIRALVRDCAGAACTMRGEASDLAAAVRWAVDHGADVVNLSVDSPAGAIVAADDLASGEFAAAVDEAWEAGVVVVAAAGNRGYPAPRSTPEHLLLVTATDADGVPASYARGVGDASWAVAAPGGEPPGRDDPCRADAPTRGIWSSWPQPPRGTHACVPGTSMAAPQVSGTLALLLAGGTTPDDAVDAVLRTARDVGLPGPDGDTGAGLLDSSAAAAAVLPLPGTDAGSTGGAPALAAAGLATTLAAAVLLGRELLRKRRPPQPTLDNASV